MTEPNPEQEEFIESLDGIYLVDAGAGTGKTFSITRRYIKLLERVEPEDIFLATFTRNAADEMSGRIASESEYSASEIYNAPISTFHAYCRQLLKRHGFDSPQLIGLDERVPRDVDVVESQVREGQEFSRFLESFRSRHSDNYGEFLMVSREEELLDLLKSLASKGVIPEQEGWFGHSERYIEGNSARFKTLFKKANRPEQRNGGERQSDLRRRLYSMKFKDFEPDAPSMEEVRGDYGTKQVREDFRKKAFEEDREELEQFVHDLYFEYLEYCLDRNYLNFAFVMMLAFVTLYEREDVREKESFEYIMIDEFQDTNEIQFKLALLLSREPNIAAVGDWKQSIYSFQHASVENITEFEDRLNNYIFDLGADRVGFEADGVHRIELERNYRSTQEILDAGESSLALPAHRKEQVEKPDTVSLESQVDDNCTVQKFSHTEEVDAVLTKIQEVKQEHDMEYSDIAVLARTRSFGLELQRRAREFDVPVTYEGGVELFATNPGKLLLAWLRILNSNSRRGWAVVLEQAGYRLEETREILETREYPAEMEGFRRKLLETRSMPAVARRVFDRYGFDSAFTEKIVEVVNSTFGNSLMNKGELVEFIEQNIEQKEIYQVDASTGSESVKIQTIHAAKGLEYPCVFVSGVNSSVFPSTNTDSKSIRMMGPAGLRQTRKFSEEHGFVFDSWQAEIISKVLSGAYDEERRLMYVAMTRAEKHLFVTAEEGRESTFYRSLEVEEVEQSIDLQKMGGTGQRKQVLRLQDWGNVPRINSMDSELGIEARNLASFAEAYLDRGREPDSPGEEDLADFLDRLDGELQTSVQLLYVEGDRSFSVELPVLQLKDGGVKLLEFADTQEDEEKLEKKLMAAGESLKPEYDNITASIFTA